MLDTSLTLASRLNCTLSNLNIDLLKNNQNLSDISKVMIAIKIYLKLTLFILSYLLIFE